MWPKSISEFSISKSYWALNAKHYFLYDSIFLSVLASFLANPVWIMALLCSKFFKVSLGLSKLSPNSLFKHSRAFSSLKVSLYLYSLSFKYTIFTFYASTYSTACTSYYFEHMLALIVSSGPLLMSFPDYAGIFPLLSHWHSVLPVREESSLSFQHVLWIEAESCVYHSVYLCTSSALTLAFHTEKVLLAVGLGGA